MPGTKGFSTDLALRDLMTVFWDKGYEGSSITDLEAATGLRRGSLYNAFGTKESMFRLAFHRYGREIEDALLADLEAPDFGTALRQMLLGLASRSEPDLPPGCLISRAATELGARQDELGVTVRQRLSDTERQLCTRLEREAAEGRLMPCFQPLRLARFIAGSMRAVPTFAMTAGQPAAIDMAGTVADHVEAVLTRD
ncbi:MAG: TetR/AcrR family transcriptional regulator [Pseudomonadota bacterium]